MFILKTHASTPYKKAYYDPESLIGSFFYIRFFNKQQFYKQRQVKIGKKSTKC